MSKEISKHIGYVFGLLESYDNSSLMSDSKFGTKLSNYEIDLVRYNVEHEIYDLNRNFTFTQSHLGLSGFDLGS